jgi:hypothetical protein
MERAMGIEPTSEAWEARNKNLKTLELAALSDFGKCLNWKMNGKRDGTFSETEAVRSSPQRKSIFLGARIRRWIALRFANGTPLLEARIVSLLLCLSNEGKSRECARSHGTRILENPDDGKTLGAECSGTFRTK